MGWTYEYSYDIRVRVVATTPKSAHEDEALVHRRIEAALEYALKRSIIGNYQFTEPVSASGSRSVDIIEVPELEIHLAKKPKGGNDNAGFENLRRE